MLKIRPFEPSDAEYAALVAVHNANWPDNPKSGDEEKRADGRRSAAYFFQRLVGELSGSIVASGECGETFWLAAPGQYYWHYNILPGHANQGFEAQMHEALMAQLARRRPRKFFVGMRDDKVEQIEFIEARGYRLIQREPTSYLDVQSFETLPFAEVAASVRQLGLEIVSVSRLRQVDPEWMRKLWELEWAITQDVPRVGQAAREPFEAFEKRVNDPDDYDAEAHFVAVRRDEAAGAGAGAYVGMTSLTYNKVDPTLGYTHLTGVVRDWRRQGVATALKAHAISAAKTQGARRIETMNNETNPMLGLNLRLGFKPGPAWCYYERVV
jgi:GNAT superfamily N-acetyltransferase